MAKTTKLRSWTKEDVRTLKTLAREKVKTSVIARKLKRSVGATYQQASKHGVTLGTSQRKSNAYRTCAPESGGARGPHGHEVVRQVIVGIGLRPSWRAARNDAEGQC